MEEDRHRFGKETENRLVKIVVDHEYTVAAANRGNDFSDFESYVDMFDAVRTEKEYDWMSDIRIPEFATHMLVQSADDVSLYFQTRDFVECYVMDKSPQAKFASAAAEECINKTLNKRGLFHYQKYVRGKLINHLAGSVWLECWWEKDVENRFAGEDESGNPVYDTIIKKDRFNYDVLDPRNVFTDNRYCYTAQEKEWVIIRSESSYEKLLSEAAYIDYFNLDLVRDLVSGKTITTSETKQSTRDRDDSPQSIADNTIDKPLDKLKRYGKFWIREDGSPGIGPDNKPYLDAQLKEVVQIFAKVGSSSILIAFHESPYIDPFGNAYRPVIRGLCYVHPTNDNGAGDGKYSRELQIAIDDTFNMSNDRTKLATIPVMKGRKNVLEETDSIFIQPGHVMDLENPESDLIEMEIRDNIDGALRQMGVLTDKMRQVTAIYPPDMGSTPAIASTTATAIASADQGSNKRGKYKAMTFENTAAIELYDMIQYMTLQFAEPETGQQLMGDLVYAFNPGYDFYYRPVSQAIESEQSKGIKVQRWTQILGYVSQIQHPGTVNVVNFILSEIASLMGKEYESVVGSLLNPNQQIESGPGSQGASGQVGSPSNQAGIPQQDNEVATREASYVQ